MLETITQMREDAVLKAPTDELQALLRYQLLALRQSSFGGDCLNHRASA